MAVRRHSPNTLLFDGESSAARFLFWLPDYLFKIVFKPFFIVGKRAKTVPRLLKFANSNRIDRAFDQLVVVVGFSAILQRGEHLVPVLFDGRFCPSSSVAIG